ncbi:cell wall hydrolase [Qipengyuania sp. JC766]|uniref:cell wall hydrolase n=1 Tax=Qipengyuania sp. JC766 TaxID=3232139 RepID=UPI0034584E53
MNQPAPTRAQQRQIRKRQGWRRLLALVAAVAVPAMAAPGEWAGFSDDIATADAPGVKPMPFEKAGFSFPGSAFYYMEDTPQVVADMPGSDLAIFDISGTGSLDQAEELAASRVGAAARAFSLSGSSLSQGRAIDCLAKAVYYEAASEAIGGQRAVAQVVLNRVAHPSYPNSVCGVVFQGSERTTGCQFSFTCDGSMRRVPSVAGMARARMVARDALNGMVYRPVGLATHYHTVWIYPYWAPSLDHIGTIGAHRFYRWKGSAGTAGAFSSRYAGVEPANAPKPRVANLPENDPADPLALARAFEEAQARAQTEAARTGLPAGTTGVPSTGRPVAPPPVYTPQVEARGGDAQFQAEDVPSDNGVKPEYANSGRWIRQPGQ